MITTAPTANRLPVVAGLVLGFGLGMFIDGIVLHQLLQWHHLVAEYESTANVSGLEENTLWDGVFHSAAWVVTLVGVILLWRGRGVSGRLPGRALVGLLLIGWGAFHAVDQFVFHLALGAHHIRQVENYQVYDWSFFGIGVVFVLTGWALLRFRSPYRDSPRGDR
jgi:uncharacterized membrane protein